jgi:hypothetical protein
MTNVVEYNEYVWPQSYCNSRYDLRSNNRDFILDKPKTNFMKKTIFGVLLEQHTVYFVQCYKYVNLVVLNRLRSRVLSVCL